jgi:hypothetical protein
MTFSLTDGDSLFAWRYRPGCSARNAGRSHPETMARRGTECHIGGRLRG